MSALCKYLHHLLLKTPREAAEAARRAWAPESVRCALEEGCCVYCALRLAAVSRPALYRVPPQDLFDAVVSVISAACDAPLHVTSRRDCPACFGLLQGHALLRAPSGAAALSLSAAQCMSRWGSPTPPAYAIPTPEPLRRPLDWVNEAIAVLASSGYDLSSGVAVVLSVPQLITAADVEFRLRLIAVLGPNRRLPDAFWFLKDVLRSLSSLWGR